MNLFVWTSLWIARKDLRIEWRTRRTTLTTLLFAVFVVVLGSLAFYSDSLFAKRVAPGVLWIALTFSGVLVVGRAWGLELERGAFGALWMSPASRTAIYCGKVLAAFALMTAVETVLLPLVCALFHIEAGVELVLVAALMGLGTLGFAAVGTLFGALSVRTQARDLVLSVAIFPLVSPVLMGGVVATRGVLLGADIEETVAWFRLLGAFDLVALAAGAFLFESLLSE